MKNFRFSTLALIAILAFLGANLGMAAEADHHGHGAVITASSAPAKPAPAAKEPGKVIGDHKVKGYILHYVLLSRAERDIVMKDMLGMEMAGMIQGNEVTGHFIVFIKDAAGKPVSGEVGFMITGPDKKTVKTLTMGMNNGYGADVIMKQKGAYIVKVKAKVTTAKGAETLTDTITVKN
ncbi:MAG: hypothetical protein HZB23_13890 [Deltaproteobacteria bacterium]|nr:hypothetical protein [Deltaproteobacteria bacterium]